MVDGLPPPPLLVCAAAFGAIALRPLAVAERFVVDDDPAICPGLYSSSSSGDDAPPDDVVDVSRFRMIGIMTDVGGGINTDDESDMILVIIDDHSDLI